MKHIFAGINRNPGDVSLVLSAASAMCEWKKSSCRFLFVAWLRQELYKEVCRWFGLLTSARRKFNCSRVARHSIVDLGLFGDSGYFPQQGRVLYPRCQWVFGGLSVVHTNCEVCQETSKRKEARWYKKLHARPPIEACHDGSRGKQRPQKRTLVLVVVKLG